MREAASIYLKSLKIEPITNYLGHTDSGRNPKCSHEETKAMDIYEKGKGIMTAIEGRHFCWSR